MNSVDQVQLNFDPATLAFLNVLIGLIMFGVALDVRVDDFKRMLVAAKKPALALVLIFGFVDGLGGIAIIAACWGVWHLISGLTVATNWSRRPVPVPEAV